MLNGVDDVAELDDDGIHQVRGRFVAHVCSTISSVRIYLQRLKN